MPLGQPTALPGDYTIAAGPNQLPAATADNRRMTAWATDRPGGAGYVVSNGTIWESPVALVTVGPPVTRTVAFATAYQASNPAKAAMVNIIIDCTTTITLAAPQANTVELVIGPTNAVASGTGVLADTFRSDLSVSILISLGWTGRQSLKAAIPAGYYFAVRRTNGTGMTVVSAYDQIVG